MCHMLWYAVWVRVLSLFSGVGGLDLGLEAAGHSVVAMCEIDPKARSVLGRHWPGVFVHDDVCSFETGEWVGRVDVVSGGSPCQDLSVAGRREGLDGARSGLFWHQCRVADEVAAPWVVWENVPGALSSNKGADFAAVLWGFTGALPELPVGGRWRSAGVVVGPKRVAVWRVFDAQYFGVAQRRRRVFVVAGPRDLCGPEILFESESLFGDFAPVRAEGEEVAGTLGGGTPGGGSRPDTDRMTFVPDVVRTFRMQAFGQYDEDDKASALKARDYKDATDLIAVPFVKAKRASSATDDETWKEGDVAPTLNQFDVGDTRTTVAVTSALGFYWHSSGRSGFGVKEEQSPTLTVGTGIGVPSPPAVQQPDMGVRRLTPRECERLMGWPDDWTRWDVDGKEIADSHRYRFCGNGVVSNVAEWVGRRLPK